MTRPPNNQQRRHNRIRAARSENKKRMRNKVRIRSDRGHEVFESNVKRLIMR